MICKKAVIGTAIAWVAALVIISFILLLYLGGVLASIKTTGFSDRRTTQRTSENELSLTRDLALFLDSEINYDGEKILVKDLISDTNDKKKMSEFAELGNEFLKSTFLSSEFKQNNKWMRIYDVDEEINDLLGSRNKYYNYDAISTRITKYDLPCDPKKEENVLIKFFILPAKYVTVCVERT